MTTQFWKWSKKLGSTKKKREGKNQKKLKEITQINIY